MMKRPHVVLLTVVLLAGHIASYPTPEQIASSLHHLQYQVEEVLTKDQLPLPLKISATMGDSETDDYDSLIEEDTAAAAEGEVDDTAAGYGGGAAVEGVIEPTVLLSFTSSSGVDQSEVPNLASLLDLLEADNDEATDE